MPRTTRHSPLERVRAGDDGRVGRTEVVGAVVDALRRGVLEDGDWLPSSRSLAAASGCSRGAVVDAYDELQAAGLVEGVPGAGSRVVAGARAAIAAGVRSSVDPRSTPSPAAAATVEPTHVAVSSAGRDRGAEPRFDLRPGVADPGLIDARDWARAWREVARTAPPTLASWRDPDLDVSGIAEHLRRHRGVVTGDALRVVPGASAAFRLCAVADGFGLVAMEDPGYVRARQAFEDVGCRIVPVPIDDQGLRVDALPAEPCTLYATPAHQYPLGVRMSADRRRALLAWARATGSRIIEDDFDSEFRYGAAPLPALRTLDGAASLVHYVGTASKLLTPGLEAAWLLPATPALDEVDRLRERWRIGVPSPVVLAIGSLARSGALTRHLARALRDYAERRRVLRAELARRMPEWTPIGIEAGLSVAVRFGLGADDEAIVRRAAARGVAVQSLSSHALDPAAPSVRGLVIGYGRIPASRIPEAVARLASVISG